MDVDVETYIPARGLKKLGDNDYFNVILVKDSKILANNLWQNKPDADNNFVNLGCEYSDAPQSKDAIAKFIERGTFYFYGGFVAISKPDIK